MNKIRVFEAFSGYGSQAMSLKRLQSEYPDILDFEFVGISEIEPSAIKAYNAVHGDTPCYGDISKIDWNEVPDFDLFTMSSPCFVAGTLVHTERGYIPIEQVTTDDKVLTHTNEYQRVIAVGHNDDSKIIKVRGMCFKDILCTPNHPFLARKRYKQWNNNRRSYDRMFTDAEWVNAERLTNDHYVGYAVNQKSQLPQWDGIIATRWKKIENKLTPLFNNPSFWYLMGRYVGDGWKRINEKYGSSVIICCSERNRESLYEALENCGIHSHSVKERTVEKVFISSNELVAFVDRYGYYAHGKKIDEETINLPIHLLQSFVQGYVDSDGCYTGNEYKATTVSEELMYGIQHCIVKAYKCPVRMYWIKRNPTTVIEGRIVNQRDSYTIAWHPEKRKQDKAFYEDGYVWFPINEVVELNEKKTVYNMEVENDNSYTANGAIVHNCQDFSVAGRQAGAEEGSGTRSSLLWECRKAIIAKRPKYILFENVSAVVSKKFIRGFNKWQAELESYGYTNYAKVLNSKDYGCPQNRERIFMLSIRGGQSYHFPKPFKLEKRIKDILEPYGTVDDSYYFKLEQLLRIISHCDRKVEEGCGFKAQFHTEDEISGCVTTRYGQRETDPAIKEGISIHPLNRKMEFQGFNSIQSDTAPCLTAHDGRGGEPCLWQRLSIYDNNAQAGRVYDVEGIAPCLDTCSGGNRMTKILEPCILGYTRDKKGNVVDYHDKDVANTVHTFTGGGWNTDQFVKEPIERDRQSRIRSKVMPNGNIRFFQADDSKSGISEMQITHPDNECPTITTAHAPKILEPISVAMRGRNPDNPSDRTKGAPTDQRLEFGNNIANCITTVQKDSMVAEPQIGCDPRKEFGIMDFSEIFPTVVATDYKSPKIVREPMKLSFENLPDKTVLKDENGKGYLWQDGGLWRVRKLTQIECFRLQGVSDEDAKKIIAVCSKTACYCLAGNSITVDVLYHLFRKLWIDTENESAQKSLFDF